MFAINNYMYKTKNNVMIEILEDIKLDINLVKKVYIKLKLL